MCTSFVCFPLFSFSYKGGSGNLLKLSTWISVAFCIIFHLWRILFFSFIRNAHSDDVFIIHWPVTSFKDWMISINLLWLGLPCNCLDVQGWARRWDIWAESGFCFRTLFKILCTTLTYAHVARHDHSVNLTDTKWALNRSFKTSFWCGEGMSVCTSRIVLCTYNKFWALWYRCSLYCSHEMLCTGYLVIFWATLRDKQACR